MIKRLQKRYALSQQGAKGSGERLSGLRAAKSFLYVPGGPAVFFGRRFDGWRCSQGKTDLFTSWGCVVCIGLILLLLISSTTPPLCHLYRKRRAADYAGGTAAKDSAVLLREKGFGGLDQHYHGRLHLFGAELFPFRSRTGRLHHFHRLISISLLVFDWRMALAALWVLPVAFAIVGFSARVQERLNQKAMDVKMACADGIQECIETVRDLKSNNAEQEYLKGLERKSAPWNIAPFSMSLGWLPLWCLRHSY